MMKRIARWILRAEIERNLATHGAHVDSLQACNARQVSTIQALEAKVKRWGDASDAAVRLSFRLQDVTAERDRALETLARVTAERDRALETLARVNALLFGPSI
jgi:cysteine sulfinate desulfinase/cysteine desulfurase-like protein